MRMFTSFAVILMAMTAQGTLAAAPQPAPAALAAPILTRAQLDALLARPAEVLLIDVRRPEEIAVKGGFPVYLSIQSADLERAYSWIPRDRTIVTVSNHAARATKAAVFLAAHGFHVAGAIGVEGYAAEGGLLTGKATAPTAP